MKTTRNAAVVLFAALLLSSCATQQVNGVKPVSPGVYMPYEKPAWALLLGNMSVVVPDKAIPQVESLQPTLKWEAVGGTESYDVVIYTGVPVTELPPSYINGTASGKDQLAKKRTGLFVQGKEVYYREAIREPGHRVEEPLNPDAVYVWSVRTRTGTTVSPWSTYDFAKGGKVVCKYANGAEGQNLWWPFRTPKQ